MVVEMYICVCDRDSSQPEEKYQQHDGDHNSIGCFGMIPGNNGFSEYWAFIGWHN
jgi:hypothetical protein